MKDFLKKIVEFADSKNVNIKKVPEATSFGMPMLKLLFYPFSLFIDNFKMFFLLIMSYSMISTIFSLIMGYSFLCGTTSVDVTGLYCSSYNYKYFIYVLIKLLIVSGFMIASYNIMSAKKNSIKEAFTFNLKTIKLSFLSLAFILLNMVPLLSIYILVMRNPNPDWIVELVFFTVVASGFLVPFILMRFYSLIAYFIETEKVYPFKEIWEKTSGNVFKIIAALFFVVFSAVFFLTNFYMAFNGFSPENLWYSATISEFIYNVILFLFVNLLLGHFYTQRVMLIEDVENEK